MAPAAAPASREHHARIRVVALIANESISGPGRQLAALPTALRGRDLHMLVAILHRSGNPPPPYAGYLESMGVEYEIIEDGGPLDTGILKRVARLLDRADADILQTHGYKATAVGWALRTRKPHRPWIGFFHGETSEDLKARFYHWLDHRMLARADRVVVMSQVQKARFAGSDVRVIHNAVLPAPPVVGTDDAGRLAELARTLQRPVLGVVGRLSPEKGVDIFIDVCRLLRQSGMVFSALIAGDGPDRPALERRTRELGLDDAVRFLGAVSNVAALYDTLDALVIPSRSEGLPNVLLEALRADLPVVSTRVGAVPEVLREPAGGIIVDRINAASIARAVPAALSLTRDPAAIAARANTVAAFSVDHRVDLHIGLYHQLVHTATAQ